MCANGAMPPLSHRTLVNLRAVRRFLVALAMSTLFSYQADVCQAGEGKNGRFKKLEWFLNRQNQHRQTEFLAKHRRSFLYLGFYIEICLLAL